MSIYRPGTIWIADNLLVMRGMDSASIDMIYGDPPFNSKRFYNDVFGDDPRRRAYDDRWKMTNRRLDEFAELQVVHPSLWHMIESARVANGDSVAAYLTFMSLRLIEMWRILKPTGNLFLHCDDSAGHWLKAILDIVAGQSAFRNHITWRRSTTGNDAVKKFRRDADYILFYAKPDAVFRPLYDSLDPVYVERTYRHDDRDSRGPYRLSDLSKPKGSDGYHYEWRGYSPPANGWRCPEETMRELEESGRLHLPVRADGTPDLRKRISRKRYLSESSGAKRGTVWANHPAEQDPVYPTAKPVDLIVDLIEAGCAEDGILFDPFCGCASAFVAADRLRREWIGCDISDVARETLFDRLNTLDTFIEPRHDPDLPERSEADCPKWTRAYRDKCKEKLLLRFKAVCRICWKEKDPDDLTLDHKIAQVAPRRPRDREPPTRLLVVQQQEGREVHGRISPRPRAEGPAGVRGDRGEEGAVESPERGVTERRPISFRGAARRGGAMVLSPRRFMVGDGITHPLARPLRRCSPLDWRPSYTSWSKIQPLEAAPPSGLPDGLR